MLTVTVTWFNFETVILIICNLDFYKYKGPKIPLKIIIFRTTQYSQSKLIILNNCQLFY